MTEEYFEYKEGVCENINCPERKAKLYYKKLFEDKKEDRDNLYEQLQKIRNALEKKDLKKDKSGNEWLAKENIKLIDEKAQAEEKLKLIEDSAKSSEKELDELRAYRKNDEEAKRKQIEEYQALPEKHKELQKKVDEKSLELKGIEDEILKSKTEIRKIVDDGKKAVEKALKEFHKIREDTAEEKQMKKDIKRVKKISGLIEKAFKFRDIFRTDKVKKQQAKIKKEFEKLSERQKKLVQEKYDEAIGI